MALDKSIKHGKEKRKQYRGVKAIDKSTRNHGSDSWAEENRTISRKKLLQQDPELKALEKFDPRDYLSLDESSPQEPEPIKYYDYD